MKMNGKAEIIKICNDCFSGLLAGFILNPKNLERFGGISGRFERGTRRPSLWDAEVSAEGSGGDA
jgi:hypothetical protein